MTLLDDQVPDDAITAATEPVDEDATIRAQALAAASRLFAGAEVDGGTFRDLEQTTVGAAERLADWVATGRYDWMAADPQPAEPGPQDLPVEWLHALVAEAAPDPHIAWPPLPHALSRAITSAYRVGYASALGYEITVSPEGDGVCIGDRPDPWTAPLTGIEVRHRQKPAETAAEPTHPDTHGTARSAAHGPHSGRAEAPCPGCGRPNWASSHVPGCSWDDDAEPAGHDDTTGAGR